MQAAEVVSATSHLCPVHSEGPALDAKLAPVHREQMLSPETAQWQEQAHRAPAMQDMCSSVPLQVSDGILSIALVLHCSEGACGTRIHDRTPQQYAKWPTTALSDNQYLHVDEGKPCRRAMSNQCMFRETKMSRVKEARSTAGQVQRLSNCR
jgi:hypothetical protein